MDRSKYTAVVMAGRRGPHDPVAAAHGTTHKCLVEVAGKPMLLRVLETLEASPSVAGIVVCTDEAFAAVPFVEQRRAERRLRILQAASSPAASAVRICEELGDELPLLIVTGDHPLLDGAMLEHFIAHTAPAADIVVGVARSADVLAAYPGAIRTVLRFSDGPFCGCNLFALNTIDAAAAARFWTRVEAQRKRPWRLVRMLGPLMLLRYLAGSLTLGGALDHLSRRLGVVASHVVMPFAEAAIDVDKPADLLLVEDILRRRESGA